MFKFQGPRGWSLNARHWKKPGALGTVVGVHGYSEHSGSYRHFAEFLHEKNLEVIWMDLPGHGLSDGERSNIDDFDDYVKGFAAFLREVRARACPEPFMVFAHSLGGLVVTRFLETSSESKGFLRGVLSSPLFGLSNYPAALLPVIRAISCLLPNWKWNNDAELSGPVLTHDLEMKAKREADSLIRPRVTIHFVREFLRARVQAFRDRDRIQIPLALFQAGEDKVTDRKEALRFFSGLKIENQIKVYDGLYHELVNEIDRARVMEDMWAWLTKDIRSL